MLSVANVRTAGGAANYFAADNYYTRADADRSGEWLGKGAAALGLEGTVDARQFEAVLKGLLPDGSRVGSGNRAHRAGTDLTFSMPKSWSVLALVGGDKRILDAYASAVRETLRWAEKNLAETRMEVRGRERVVQTGNLAIALFQHDTNRNQEPNAHFHAVIANVTRGADMAQGLTSDRGIAVMDSRERNLANQQTFLVTVTRLRDGLTLYVDNAGKLEAAVERNAGMKRSALETVDLLRDAASKGQAKDRAAPAPERKPPELDRSITKPFEIGI